MTDDITADQARANAAGSGLTHESLLARANREITYASQGGGSAVNVIASAETSSEVLESVAAAIREREFTVTVAQLAAFSSVRVSWD